MKVFFSAKYLKIFIIFMLGFFSINFAAAIPKNNTTIKIGAIYNFDDALNVAAFHGASLAIFQINKKGGILGHHLELVSVNAKNDNNDMLAAAHKLIKNKDITTIISFGDSKLALATIPLFNEGGKLFIASAATSPKLVELYSNNVCLTCFPDNDQALAAAKFISETFQNKNVYLLKQTDSEYANLLATYFQKGYNSLGGKIPLVGEFTARNSDISKLLNKAHTTRLQPGVIYIAADSNLAPNIVKQLRNAGFNQPIFGSDSFDSKFWQKSEFTKLDNTYFTNHAFISKDHIDPNMPRFIKAYHEMFQDEPTSFAALGYDTIYLLKKVITSVHSTNPGSLKNAFLGIHNFDGITGTINYLGDDCIPNKTVTLVKIDQGKIFLVKEIAI